MFYSTSYSSPLGLITLAGQNNKLIAVWIEGQKYFGDTVNEQLEDKPNLAIFNETKKWFDNYFSGKNPAIKQLPLAPIGTPFRYQVWDILCKIPYGEITTYGDIAKKIAKQNKVKTMSSQAVGGAVGRNPISIIIPCHRVIGANGNLTGYAGGIDKKIKLLQIEGIDTQKFYRPTKGTAL
ncbi:cysteine methyltransferase [Gilliamella sp. Choc4-2]|jgi:methylated-DNA-[protein]-cysteine S-methyltransferase|uniref:methylated-DNA--[protein]-cysteine S-methyltransferase n=1 Tax=unclassified Gilliamella TaxID=2685620 RepID=UPI00080E9E55|nr:methylated-DNA--[protein]-cysteine S-methyltransferase [Gilliamella apicola]OCG30546.1 cysteine methyltransferase [Gilliamella apicola]OCG43043.1 cysteine methyltransferase [Gilliamella apicola]OCG54019.1 cysteine methyltransferase [Gilliamella apicola]